MMIRQDVILMMAVGDKKMLVQIKKQMIKIKNGVFVVLRFNMILVTIVNPMVLLLYLICLVMIHIGHQL